MGVIDEVKQKTDIVEVVSQYVRLTKAGRTFRGLCPFHSEKHPSFFVYPEQQSWHCFGACNTGGDVLSFIMKKQGIDFGQSLHLLADKAGITISARSEQEAEGKERLYQANQAAAQYFHNLLLNSPAGEKTRKYIDSRGLSPKTITDFQLGFSSDGWEALKQYLMDRGYTESELLTAGLVVKAESGETHDRFRNRLMFPILDARGRTIGFGARVLDPSPKGEGLPKYLNSPQTPIFDKGSSLYGINLATQAIRQQNLAVIVEGYMDAITAHQNGFTNVVASMGTSVTERQVSVLKKLTKNMALALDADAAGEEASLRGVGYENALGTEVKVVILPRGKDPDNIIKQDAQAWQHLVEEALPVVDFTFNTVTFKLDLTTARDKSLAVDKLLPIIAEMKDDTRRDHYLTKLSTLTGVTYRNLEAALGRIKADRKAKGTKPEAVARTLRTVVSDPREEYCLALLLQHPELRGSCQGLLSEYFENSENREIFIACQQADDVQLIKEKLDTTIHDHLNSLVTRSLPPTTETGRKHNFDDCVLRLREKYLRSLVTKMEEVLALEAELGGTAAELAKLEEQGIEVNIQLGEIFAQRGQKR